MDDRDFIYWINGIFEFAQFETLKSEQVDQIIERLCDVYESIRENGAFNDLDSMRIISFIEGALMYYNEASIEYKIKVTNLIRNEVALICERFEDKDEEKMPMFKRKPDLEFKLLDIIPIGQPQLLGNHANPYFESIENYLANGFLGKDSLKSQTSLEIPKEKANKIFNTLKESLKSFEAESLAKTDDQRKKSSEPNKMKIFDDFYDKISSEMSDHCDEKVSEKSLDTITEKIISRR